MTTHAQYEAYAQTALLQEEHASRNAKRDTTRFVDALGKGEPAHQPFDLQTAATEHPVIQGAQGYRIAVHMISLYNSGDSVDVTYKDGAGGSNLMGPLVSFPTNVGYLLPWQETPLFTLAPGRAFIISAGAAGAVRLTGFIKYRLIEGGAS
jgi:hypothetical protein